ncbi:MAG TPA: AMIN domain-containing protein, partial [Arenimonas sp.]|nr:AMIN domain-containing protein [Arenimonas sp.]
MTTNYENGRLMGGKRLGLAAAAFALCLTTSGWAAAGNVLKDVRYSAAPGGKVDITLEFAEAVGDVNAFTTDKPPRIAIDLPATSNGLSQRRVVVGAGATSSVTAAEAGGRTRVVVDLFRPAGYTTRSAGNLLVLSVDAGQQAVTAD